MIHRRRSSPVVASRACKPPVRAFAPRRRAASRASSPDARVMDRDESAALLDGDDDRRVDGDASASRKSSSSASLTLRQRKWVFGFVILVSPFIALTVNIARSAPLRTCVQTVTGAKACATTERCVEEACRSTEEIPRVIWMLWDEGFDRAPATARRARDSWIEYNPDFDVRPLDLRAAMELCGTNETGSAYHVPGETWAALRVQHKADLLRSALLAKYGGVWADASLQANAPLNTWLDVHRQAHLLQRTDNEARRAPASRRPWFSVWFIAAAKNSYVAERLATEFYADVRGTSGEELDYYHMAHVLARLWNEDEKFRETLGPSRSADHAHCMVGDPRRAPFFKRCSRAVLNHPFDMREETAWKSEVG